MQEGRGGVGWGAMLVSVKCLRGIKIGIKISVTCHTFYWSSLKKQTTRGRLLVEIVQQINISQ